MLVKDEADEAGPPGHLHLVDEVGVELRQVLADEAVLREP